jgi:hypothetical protein
MKTIKLAVLTAGLLSSLPVLAQTAGDTENTILKAQAISCWANRKVWDAGRRQAGRHRKLGCRPARRQDE